MGEASRSPLPWLILYLDVKVRQESSVFFLMKVKSYLNHNVTNKTIEFLSHLFSRREVSEFSKMRSGC